MPAGLGNWRCPFHIECANNTRSSLPRSSASTLEKLVTVTVTAASLAAGNMAAKRLRAIGTPPGHYYHREVPSAEQI